MKVNKLKGIFKRNNPPNVESYWEKRYSNGGNSGAGSYGEVAKFKALTINKFLYDSKISNVIDFGCGDGAQLELLNINDYTGVDVSKTAILRLQEKYICKKNYKFKTLKEFTNQNGGAGRMHSFTGCHLPLNGR